jgi:diguanylate cyclase
MTEKGNFRSADGGWKEKYLESLETLEQVEAKSAEQIDLLKRCMVRVSLAADGIDPELDATMGMLRDTMRQDLTTRQLETVGSQVEGSVLELDKRKASNNDELLAQFELLINQLLSLEPPRKVKNSLKRFQKTLEPVLENTYLKAVTLAEYAEFQADILEAAFPEGKQAEKPGFFKKLFSADEARPPVVATSVQETDVGDPKEFELEDESQARPASGHGSGEKEPALAAPEADAIKERMGGILLTMLDLLYIPQSWEQQEEAIRQRIARGIHWPEIPDTLSEIVSLVNNSTHQMQKDTEVFLQNLNMRLCDIQDFLAENQHRAEQKQASGEHLDQVVKGHIKDISQRLDSGVNLGELKGSIEQHLDRIMGEIDSYKKQEKNIDEETLESVKALTSRIEMLEKEARVIRDSYVEAKEQAFTDTLTKLPNRLAYEKRSLQEYSRWQRYQNPLSLAVCDLDLFKRINDSYGHTAGDKVLKKTGDIFRQCLRNTDFICRFGGEEFVILLAETSLEQAKLAMEKLRQTVEESPFHFRGERVVITVSIGISAFTQGDSLEKVFERADKAVYEAKDQGRNQVVIRSVEAS